MIELSECRILRGYTKKKIIGSFMTREDRVAIRCPKDATDEELLEYLKKNSVRLEKERENWRRCPVHKIVIKEGGYLPYFGRMILLKEHDEPVVRLAGAENSYFMADEPETFAYAEDAVLNIPSERSIEEERGMRISQIDLRVMRCELVRKWYINRAREFFVPLTRRYAEIMGVKCPQVVINCAVTNHGCFHTNGYYITYSYPGIAHGKYALEALAVHELAHTRHLDHSKAFYAEIDRYMPDYKVRNKVLSDNGWARRAVMFMTEYMFAPEEKGNYT